VVAIDEEKIDRVAGEQGFRFFQCGIRVRVGAKKM
jgi:hypothetical protein